MRKVAILVLNFSMPEMTDALVASIQRIVKHPHDLFVIDNGSPEDKVAKTTTHRKEENARITGGFNWGIQQIRQHEERMQTDILGTPDEPEYAEGYPYDGIWFVCNDIRLVQPTVDPVAACMAHVHASRERGRPIGIIHPSMQVVSGVWNHPHMNHRRDGVREEVWVDIICPIYTREMLEVMGWEFMPELVYGWGIDRYTCAEAWWNRLRVCVCDDAQVWHRMGTTYNAGADPEFEDFEAYKAAAGGSQGKVLSEKYGENYMERFALARERYYAGE